MPRLLQTYVLAGAAGSTFNEAHQQLNTTGGNTEQTLVLERDCSAVMLSARTGNAYVTFNNTVAASTNGIEILAGAQPVLIPLGAQCHDGGNVPAQAKLRCIGSVASTILNVLQLA